MALSKIKQVKDDSVLDKAPRAEHGLARMAHVNTVIDEVNKVVGPIAKVSNAALLARNHANNAAAKTAGLVNGDIYHTAGAVKIVTA
jgi:hypothetical protein|tara:strand:+ start:260 stop:520 length:261 start_codon:yes stop_codon:yes gene_type:complete